MSQSQFAKYTSDFRLQSSVTSLALLQLQPQNKQGSPNIILLASNDDKNYRNTCMHHIKPTGIALPWSIGTTAFNLYDLCTLAVCEGLDPFAVPNKELNPELQLKFCPLHTCQQLEINRVQLAAKRLSARLALLPPFRHSACA